MKRVWILLFILMSLGLTFSNVHSQSACDSEGVIYVSDMTGNVGFVIVDVSDFCASSDGSVSAIVTLENTLQTLYVGVTIESPDAVIEPIGESAVIWRGLQLLPPQGIYSEIVGESRTRYRVTFTEPSQRVSIYTNVLSFRGIVMNLIVTSVNALSAYGQVPTSSIARSLLKVSKVLTTLDDIVESIDCFSTEGVANFPTFSDWDNCTLAVDAVLQNNLFQELVRQIMRDLGLQMNERAFDQVIGSYELLFNARDFVNIIDSLNAGGSVQVAYGLAPSSDVLVDPPRSPILNEPIGVVESSTDIVFRWEPQPIIGQTINSYRLEISNSLDFSMPIYDVVLGTMLEFTPSLDFSPSTNYYWRVQAVNQAGASVWSDAEFMVSDEIPTIDSNTITAPGSYQNEIGCPRILGVEGDWAPDCTLSVLNDPDEDGIYELRLDNIPIGNYEVKIAIGGSWDENYGMDGRPDGANVPFTVRTDNAAVIFTYNSDTNIVLVAVTMTEPMTIQVPSNLADNSWFDTGVDLNYQARFSIQAIGNIDIFPTCETARKPDDSPCSAMRFGPSGSEGIGIANDTFPLPGALVGALIGKVGNQGDPFLIGSGGEFVAQDTGRLYLRINDYWLADNIGEFTVTVELLGD